MTIQLTAFRWVPPFAQGYVRDLRLRWALEEAGLPYEVELIDRSTLTSESYRHWQPFSQVPAYRDDQVEMFESGAIVLHIAEQSERLCPRDPAGRARVMTWVIAALNSIEPYAQNRIHLSGAVGPEGKAQIEGLLDHRLAGLSHWLGEKDYLEGDFTAADIVMGCVLRELVDCGALAKYPNLDAYRRRCEARPAFVRSLEAQLQTFRENEPA